MRHPQDRDRSVDCGNPFVVAVSSILSSSGRGGGSLLLRDSRYLPTSVVNKKSYLRQHGHADDIKHFTSSFILLHIDAKKLGNREDGYS